MAVARPVSRSSSVKAATEATPVAGLQGIGAEHAGNDIRGRSHVLPTAGRIKGLQVGSGGTDRFVPPSKRWQEILIERNDHW